MKLDGPDFASGDRVRLHTLGDEFLADLPKEDVAELTSLIGQVWTVDEWHAPIEQVEITCWIKTKTGEARSHSVWVPPKWVERIR
jgi:hypothetical protein